MKRLIFALTMPLFMLISGCSDNFKKGDLIGKFILNVGPSLDVIELNEDSTYIHNFESNNYLRVNHRGKWDLEDTPDGQMVSLQDFQPSGSDRRNAKGFYLLKPERFFGSIRLVRNSDLNEYYKKE